MSQTVPSKTTAVFLATLPAERRREFERVWDVVRLHLPAGYEEAIGRNTLICQVPRERYADTYNGYPLLYVALASEKSYLSLHLMPLYGDRASARLLADSFRTAGKKLSMGKACIRFKKADDLALDVIGQIVERFSPDQWVQIARSARRR